MSSQELSGILENSKELDRLRKELEEVLLDINKLHKKLQSSESRFTIFMFYFLLHCRYCAIKSLLIRIMNYLLPICPELERLTVRYCCHN